MANANKFLLGFDDGHGYDPKTGVATAGKRTPKFPDGSVIYENQFNRKAAYYAEQAAKRCGFKTMQLAPEASDTPLSTRVNRANKARCSAVISFHYNAFRGVWDDDVSGIGTFYYPGSRDSQRLAQCVQKYVSQGTKQKNRGIKSADFYVLRETNMTAVLIENGFMDNPYEASLMLKEAFQKEQAEQAIMGVCEYFDVPYVQEDKPDPDPNEGIIYRVQVGAFRVKENAEKRAIELKANGFDAFIVTRKNDDDVIYKIQTGAFRVKENAEKFVDELIVKGYDAIIVKG